MNRFDMICIYLDSIPIALQTLTWSDGLVFWLMPNGSERKHQCRFSSWILSRPVWFNAFESFVEYQDVASWSAVHPTSCLRGWWGAPLFGPGFGFKVKTRPIGLVSFGSVKFRAGSPAMLTWSNQLHHKYHEAWWVMQTLVRLRQFPRSCADIAGVPEH